MLKKSSKQTVLCHAACLSLFLLTCLLTGPDNFRAPHKFLPDLQDTVLAMALMSWPAHCLQLVHCSIADFPIFYPEKNTLFFTDSLVGIGFIFNSLKAFLSIHLSYNLTLLTLAAFNFYSFFLLMRFARIRYLSAFISSTAFAAIPYILQFGSHIQLYTLFFWPLSLLFLLKFFEVHKILWLYCISIALALTFYLSMSIAIKQFFYVVIALLISLLSSRSVECKNLLRFRWPVRVVISMLISATILMPLAYQYYQVRKIHPFIRDISDSIPYSLDLMALPRYLLSFGVSSNTLNVWGFNADSLQKYDDLVLGGLMPWAVCFVMIVSLIMFQGSEQILSLNPRTQRLLRISSVSLVVSAILMLGPNIVIAGNVTEIPSLYKLFYYVVPGFNALRVPVRFVIPLVIYASIILGVCLDSFVGGLFQTSSKKKKMTAFALCSILIFAFVVDRSYPYSERPQAWTKANIPVAYDVVRENPGAPVLELPMWPPARNTFKYFYYLMQDWNPRLGGISSFFPESFYKLRGQTNNCPTKECLEFISQSKAEILIVHLQSLGSEQRMLWNNAMLDDYGFKLQSQSDLNTMIWLRNRLAS